MYSRGIFVKKVSQTYLDVPLVSHRTKNVDDQLEICSAVFTRKHFISITYFENIDFYSYNLLAHSFEKYNK